MFASGLCYCPVERGHCVAAHQRRIINRHTNLRGSNALEKVLELQLIPPARSAAAWAPCSRSLGVAVHATSAAAEELRTGLWEPDGEKLQQAMLERFNSADLDGNGVIDRDELRILLEGFEDGKAAPEAHWLTEEEVDAVLTHYDTDGSGNIALQEFEQLAKDGVLLHGTLQQYSEAFDAVDSDHDGLVTAEQLGTLLGDCGSSLEGCHIAEEFARFEVEQNGRIGFYEFLRMFRQHLLDLESVVDYLHQPAGAQPTPAQTAEAAAAAAAVPPGEVKVIESEAELDELLASDERPAVLLAGMTWCRPCKSLQMPFQKLAQHYPGVKFVKFYGNANESSKVLFRDRLKARATPTIAMFSPDGTMGHSHTGANKAKLEFYLRDFIGDEDSETLYPPYQLTEKELEARATAASREA